VNGYRKYSSVEYPALHDHILKTITEQKRQRKSYREIREYIATAYKDYLDIVFPKDSSSTKKDFGKFFNSLFYARSEKDVNPNRFLSTKNSKRRCTYYSELWIKNHGGSNLEIYDSSRSHALRWCL
jgi:hypothetical protein